MNYCLNRTFLDKLKNIIMMILEEIGNRQNDE